MKFTLKQRLKADAFKRKVTEFVVDIMNILCMIASICQCECSCERECV